MNWIKRLLHFFKADDEDPIEINTTQIRQNKHIEARVTYEYPKGKFRFPVIPDQEIRKTEKVQRRRTQQTSTSQPKRNTNPKPVVKVQEKQPFRPTETPSPVYGLSKPKPHETIEFELPLTPITDTESIARAWKEAQEEVAPTILQTEQVKPELQIVSDVEKQQKVVSFANQLIREEEAKEELDYLEPYVQDSISEETPVQVSTRDSISEETPVQVSTQDSISEETSVQVPTHDSISEETPFQVSTRDSISEETPVQVSTQDSIREETPVQVFTQDSISEETPVQDSTRDFISEETPVQVSTQDSNSEETPILTSTTEVPDVSIEPNVIEQDMVETESMVEEPQQPTDDTDIMEVSTEHKAEVNEDSVEVDEADPHAEQIQRQEQINSEPRRSHIPFNVLMFKKDKQKLSQKETRQVSQPDAKEPTESDKKQEQPILQETSTEMEQAKQQELELHSPNEELISSYSFPGLSFLNAPPAEQHDDSQWLLEQRNILDQTLRNFKVGAKVVNVTQGPAVTRFEVHPEPGVKVNKITNLTDDIKLSLAAKDIRIEAPIPGKNTIGIEVPNKKSKPVLLKEIIQSSEFTSNKSPLTVAMGLDISGKPIVTDLQKMPHGLIAGATGSGKSVCINAMLVSLLYKASPDEVKLLLIDPKMVELAPYNHIPHLVSPVITDVKAATASLKWAVEEMERRYELFAHTGVRDIGRYNEMVKKHDEKSGKLPYLVIIIDELADLMMVAPGDVEDSICRIAQKARACGIHLILATQRPSVDVITGLIKANIPTRIAFSVSSQVDSRTIIDSSGAEKLLGKGDMLFLENGSSKPFRVQGNFVSDDEIEAVVDFVKAEMKPSYMFEQDELLKKASISNDEDELFLEACEFVLEHGGASTSSVQRRFRIGYNRAARLIDMMEEQGIISESRGSKPRDVLITEEELAEFYEG
ncbi:DNA translocase FtsK [Bacillus sp. HNG]|uniref:DNA translocase FtsK n=1 Tax=Bacillus sp. HNG TaxID=2293325 RepID=UPI000E2EE318|nr:DNA translocase FtsK [Bacillus sp. HNG]RFB17841.1 DNA translocase FtsK [Bacillus sp. HNG]